MPSILYRVKPQTGLHISLLGGLLFRLMRRARVPIPVAGIITIAGLLLYGMMT